MKSVLRYLDEYWDRKVGGYNIVFEREICELEEIIPPQLAVEHTARPESEIVIYPLVIIGN
jgi:hypothetical protein